MLQLHKNTQLCSRWNLIGSATLPKTSLTEQMPTSYFIRDLQVSLTSVKVSFPNSTIRKRLGKVCKPLLIKKNTKDCLIFAKKKNVFMSPKTLGGNSVEG